MVKIFVVYIMNKDDDYSLVLLQCIATTVPNNSFGFWADLHLDGHV